MRRNSAITRLVSLTLTFLFFGSIGFSKNKYILDSEPTANKKSSSAKSLKNVEVSDYRQKAFEELKPSGKSYSENYLPTSATVTTKEITSANPVIYNGLQLGMTYQNYQPKGTVPLAQIPNVDLSQLKKQSLLGLELRYNPWKVEMIGTPTVGFRFGSSYTKQAVPLLNAQGKDLGPTQLQTIYSHAMLSTEWHFSFSEKLSWGFDAGLANLNVIQSSENNLGNNSDQRNYFVYQTGPLLKTGSLWWTLNYQSRQQIGTARWAQLDNSTVIFGVLYGLR